MVPKPIEVAFPILVRSALIRRAVARTGRSRLRRAFILRFAGWSYRRFNSSGKTPVDMLRPDVQVEQTAAFIDTAGTFRGVDGFEAMIRELRDAFGDARWVPVRAIELSHFRVLLIVRFEATGRGSGTPVHHMVGHLLELDKELRIQNLSLYWSEAEALEAAGFRE